MNNEVDKISNERLLDVPTHNDNKLTYKEVRFIDEYMLCGNAREAYRRAFPDASETTVQSRSTALLHKNLIAQEISKRSQYLTKSAIMSTNEILELYSSIARGEEKDQFGLDAQLKDRFAAAKELLKYRTEVLEKDKEDNTLTIKLVR